MKFKTEIKKIGSSSACLIIPIFLMRNDKLGIGQKVMVNIEKCKEPDEDLDISYQCKDCNHEFFSSDKKPYCPSCTSENLEDNSKHSFVGIIDDFGMESFAKESETTFPYVMRANLNTHRNAKAYRVRISMSDAEKFTEKFIEKKDWIECAKEIKLMNAYEELN